MLKKLIANVGDFLTRDGKAFSRLESTFQVNKKVRNRATGEVFTVDSAECSYALLSNSTRRKMVDWLTPAGTLRHGVVEAWEAYPGPEHLPAQLTTERLLNEPAMTGV